MNASALRVGNVSKHFGRVVAVDDVSFELGPHEIVALVGPSGCGKSTLLRVLGGVHPADRGRIELAGEIVDDGHRSLPPERRRIGLVFQDHALFPHLTVSGNVGFGVREPRERAARVGEMLELVGLAGYGERYPHELSGGERQRVALARSLALRPVMMLLDEPFASLDPNLRARIRDDVVAILRSTGTPALFVTHDQPEALAIGDRVAVMRGGRIVQLDAPYTVFHHPADRFVAGFMGEADFVSPAEATALGGVPATGTSGAGAVMVRPDDVLVAPSGTRTVAVAPETALQAASHVAAHVTAEVVAAEFRGAAWCYTLRLSTGSTIRCLRSHHEPLDVGAVVTPRLRPDHHLTRFDGDDRDAAADLAPAATRPAGRGV